MPDIVEPAGTSRAQQRDLQRGPYPAPSQDRHPKKQDLWNVPRIFRGRV
jgi:hypothetical protein